MTAFNKMGGSMLLFTFVFTTIIATQNAKHVTDTVILNTKVYIREALDIVCLLFIISQN